MATATRPPIAPNPSAPSPSSPSSIHAFARPEEDEQERAPLRRPGRPPHVRATGPQLVGRAGIGRVVHRGRLRGHGNRDATGGRARRTEGVAPFRTLLRG